MEQRQIIEHQFGKRWFVERLGDEVVVRLYDHEFGRYATPEEALDEIALSEGISSLSREAPSPGI
jgi:hypothetical protein